MSDNFRAAPKSRSPVLIRILRSPLFRSLSSVVPFFQPGSSIPGSSAPYLGGPIAPSVLHCRPGQSVRSSLIASSAEGMMAEVVTACAGGAVLTGWALYLNCSALCIGILGALPFLSQLVQLPAAWFTSFLGHRRVAIAAVAASRQALLPLAVLPFLPLSESWQRTVLLAVAAASSLLGVVGNNAWVTWMGELVPLQIRGRYFGRRTASCTLSGVASSLAAGLALDGAGRRHGTGTALAVLALLACIAGAISAWLMTRQSDTAPAETGAALELRAAVKPLLDPSAQRVLAYQIAWNAAVGIAGSFFSLHMLCNLKMGFALVAAQGAAVAAVRILAAPLWGKTIDRVGARPVLVACCFGICATPIIWLLATPDFLWPVALDAVYSGGLWAGHGLASFQLPLSVAPRRGRAFYLAAFSTAGGISYALASAAGGALVTNLPADLMLGNRPLLGLHVLFILSAAGRLAAALFSLRIVEPRSRSLDELFRLTWTGASRFRLLVARVPPPR